MTGKSESSGLPAVIDNALADVPGAWRIRLTKTLVKLIGATAAPELARAVSDEFDTLAGRSVVANEMAKAVAARLTANPEVVERAAMRFYGDAIERQQNLEEVARLAAAELSGSEEERDVEGDIAADWRRKFADYAADVSGQEMQQVWARILAGEFRRPGAFSYRTLRIVSEMDGEVAGVFAELAAHRLADNAIYAPGETWNSGKPLRQLKMMEDRGLVHERAGQTVRPVKRDTEGRYYVHGSRASAMLFAPSGRDQVSFPIIEYTQAGRELLALLEPSDERAVVENIVRVLRPQIGDCLAAFSWLINRQTGKADELRFLWGDHEALGQLGKR